MFTHEFTEGQPPEAMNKNIPYSSLFLSPLGSGPFLVGGTPGVSAIPGGKVTGAVWTEFKSFEVHRIFITVYDFLSVLSGESCSSVMDLIPLKLKTGNCWKTGERLIVEGIRQDFNFGNREIFKRTFNINLTLILKIARECLEVKQ